MANVIVILNEEKLLAAVIQIPEGKTAEQTFEQWATRGAAEIGLTPDEYSNGFTYEEK
jgi:hypothetical protein